MRVTLCAGPGCGQPLSPKGTGRPRRYCCGNCRQAAKRARDRAAEAERVRLIRLAEASAAAAEAEQQAKQDAAAMAGLAAAVTAAAAGTDRRALGDALMALGEAARRLQAAARRQFDEAGLAAQLDARPAIPAAAFRDGRRGGRDVAA